MDELDNISCNLLSSVLKIVLFLLFIVVSSQAKGQLIFYVDSASGNDNYIGTSWNTSFRNVTKAVALAQISNAAEVQIWIAKGTYTPTQGISVPPVNHRDTSFTFYRGNGINRALKVYGGFAGNETSIVQRDTSHITYLDGNIGNGLRSYHVVIIAGLAAAADSIILDGICIRNGNGGDTGSKLYNGILTERFTGAGLYLVNDTAIKLKINNCRITYNKIIGNINGAPQVFGGGMSVIYSAPSITNCTFDHDSVFNEAGDASAGALYNLFSSSIIVNCNFNNNGSYESVNYSFNGGGAIYNASSSPIIKNCHFQSNNTSGYGGCVYNESSSPTLEDCIFTSNTCHSPYSSSGGAVCNSTSPAIIRRCSFNSNQSLCVLIARGGAIYNVGTATPLIDSCTFSSNIAIGGFPQSGASAYGGAIYNYISSPFISNSDFIGNTAYSLCNATGGTANGGALYNDGASPSLYNCHFLFNIAKGFGNTNPSINAYAYGGAVYNHASYATFTACNFTSDSAYGHGYQFPFSQGFGYGGGVYNNASFTNFISCAFDANAAAGDNTFGGALYDDADGVTILAKCIFDSNKAATAGGAVVCHGYLVVRNCVFRNHKAAAGSVLHIGDIGVNSSLYGSGNIFANNLSTAGGGCIYLYMNTGTDTLLNNLFINNKDTSVGGGGALHITGSTNYIANNTFYADSSISGSGGAVYILAAGGHYTFSNNIFRNNYSSISGTDTAIAGSGIFNFNNNLWSTTNPFFADTTNPIGPDGIWATGDDGLQLQHCSPGRNSGSNSFVLAAEITDIKGSPRIVNTTVDIGAYEIAVAPIQTNGGVCIGDSIILADTTHGGAWVNGNPALASLTSSGVLTGLSAGTDTVRYMLTDSCGTDTVTAIISVNATANAGTIIGDTLVCQGATVLLTDSVAGGTWVASNNNVSVTGGLVTGLTTGVDSISYTNSCGMAVATHIVSVRPQPHAGVISGPTTICIGDPVTLLDTAAGGMWAVTNNKATILNNVITGAYPGYDTVIYMVMNSCGTDTAVMHVEVIALPNAGTLTLQPNTVICVGSDIYIIAPAQGGVWSTSSGHAHFSGSFCYGDTPGPDTIRYIVSNVCGSDTASVPIIVEPFPAPAAVVGPIGVCIDSSIVLSDVTPNGTWSASNTFASVNGGVITGLAQGTDTIYYTISNYCGSGEASKKVVVSDCSLEVSSQSMPDYMIYPIPTSDNLIIKSQNRTHSSITIVNSTGTVMCQQIIQGNETIIDTKSFLAGIYTISIKGQTEVLIRKFVVIH